MIRREHFWYDVRRQLVNFKFLLALMILGSFLILYINFGFVYLFALLLAGIFAIRGLIGRRCPHCDGPLREEQAQVEQDNAFIIIITWRCPRDGYEELEKTKGDAGLFGVN
jgi:hypothetical protein